MKQVSTIPTETLQSVLNYLTTRPFREVAGLIKAVTEETVTAAPEAPKATEAATPDSTANQA